MKTFKQFITESQIAKDIYLLSEGGASGHLSHLYDHLDLTFAELKTIIGDVLAGKIEMTEKTDGQLMAARNKTTLQDPMMIDEVASKFAGRGPIQDAFVNSMRDVQSAIMSLSEKERQAIFNDGHNYMAFEIIYPPTKNVVNYGNKALIQFHGVNLYDEKWKKIGEDKSLAKKLYSLLQSKDALNQKVFTITGPAILSLKKDFASDIPKFIKKLSKIQGSIKDTQTLRDWIKAQWREYFNGELDYLGMDEVLDDPKLVDTLINRWAFYDKSINKNNIVKELIAKLPSDSPDSIKDWFNNMEAASSEINKSFLRPLELFTIELGGQILNNVEGLISANPDMTVQDMRQELDDAIKTIKSSNVESALKKLNYSLSKIEKVGYDKIAPTEGLVILYKGKPLKLTGLFGSINQIIGMFKYGR